MASISTRPTLYNAVGGFLPNPIQYEITSSLDFEVVTIHLRNSPSDAFTTYQKKQRVISGVVVLDISNQLQSFVSNTIEINPTLSIYENEYLEFYISGAGFDDVANPRFAFGCAIDSLDSDMQAYVLKQTYTELAKFTNRLPQIQIYKELANNFINVYYELGLAGLTNLYLNIASYDRSKTLINENNIQMNLSVLFKNAHIVLPFVLSAVLASCQVQKYLGTYTNQLFLNPTFYDTSLFNKWTLGVGNVIGSDGSGTIPVAEYLSPSGGGTIPFNFQSVSQSVRLEKYRKYKIRFNYNITDAVATWKSYLTLNGVVIDFATLTYGLSQTYEYVYTHNQLTGYYNVGIINSAETNNVPSRLQYNYFHIIEENVLLLTEAKDIEYKQLNCNSPYALQWINNLGAWETFAFDGYSDFNTDIVKNTSYLQTDARQKRTIQKGERANIVLRQTDISKEQMNALRGLITSKEVHLLEKDKTPILVELQSNNVALTNTKEVRFEMQITCLLPYSNS